MVHVRPAAAVLALLVLASCSSEDPRLPQQLYEEAIQLNQAGQSLEAKALMEKLANRYPETGPGQQARKDLYLLDALLHQDLLERQKLAHNGMKRVADALTRYKTKRGEYPRFLADLVPEYLEQAPETPWKHPYFYRPYVTTPIAEVRDRKGRMVQVFGTKLDGYQLVSLGVDLQPGGDDLAADQFVINGEFVKLPAPPPIPTPQPIR